jgi:hypothetical protein
VADAADSRPTHPKTRDFIVSPERSLEEVIPERAFTGLLQGRAHTFFKLSNALLAAGRDQWGKKHYYQLMIETEDLESFMDDYGARYNRSFGTLRELIASTRWFALTGYSLAHLESRIESYDVRSVCSESEAADLERSLERVRKFTRRACGALLEAIRKESHALGLEITPETFSEAGFAVGPVRQQLPRNVGEHEPTEEQQKIAEVASKFLAACSMLDDVRIRRIAHAADRKTFLARLCSEEQARVYEATVHNLQSTYDTYIKNTVLEGRDERLPRLRGLTSAALHLLECATFLTHFVERHEGSGRDQVQLRVAQVVDGREVQDAILNVLLYWADALLRRGRRIAEDLLPAYTNVQELSIELSPDLKLHARPAALIVGIVGHYGTPVELVLAGNRCNAASILEVLVTVGTYSDERRYVFRGDVRPLQDIKLLFEHGLGEHGLESLPEQLAYLKSRN